MLRSSVITLKALLKVRGQMYSPNFHVFLPGKPLLAAHLFLSSLSRPRSSIQDRRLLLTHHLSFQKTIYPVGLLLFAPLYYVWRNSSAAFASCRLYALRPPRMRIRATYEHKNGNIHTHVNGERILSPDASSKPYSDLLNTQSFSLG